jgi:DNA modification methylase
MEVNKIIQGDAYDVLRTFPDKCIDCTVTSPPYWKLRTYNVDGQLGLESTVKEYIESLQKVFSEIYRVLKDRGTCWVNIGDSYNGSGKDTGNTGTYSQHLIKNRRKSRPTGLVSPACITFDKSIKRKCL